MNSSNAFWSHFVRPLENKQVPTISQLESWLSIDRTNEYHYNFPDFICQEYAAILVLHARAQEWQMGFVNVYGYDTNTGEEWNHSLNAVVTTDGLVYVEPQNDAVWWYAGHAEMKSGQNYQILHSDPPRTIHIKKIEVVVKY